jgi:hypothetical protein
MDMNREGNKNHMNKKDHRKSSIRFMLEHLQLLSVITIYKTFMRVGSSRKIIERHK